ncbi:tetratricopeptide repeat protein [Aquabacterium sp.]|uniref:tetratricopeptide repeat protein n=1 Tax=Aquabacterium sp. TaxID=1872578 RepID=UPI0037833692
MARWICVLMALWLAGCASHPLVTKSEQLFDDTSFKPASERINPADALALSDEMRGYLQREMGNLLLRREPQRVLLEQLYTHNQLKLRYDTEMTRSAAQAFEARAGNCMSLVLMTAAFARELGLQVRYQSVYVDPNWGRRGDLYFTIGHINLSVGKPLVQTHGPGDAGDWLTVDFLPQRELRGQRYDVIDEPTVIAMYLNNKAAEAMADGRVDDAYWWVKAAIQQDRQLLLAYNTLGVIYQRHGLPARAEAVLRFALALEPTNVHVAGNLAQLLTSQGRAAEAAPLIALAERLQPDPPFKYFNLGREAMARGEYRQAKSLFEREIGRDPDYHEFYFWLALADLKLGDVQHAQRNLETAREKSGSRREEALYAAKLARLKADLVQ